ncbi:MAG: CotH kinase family protein, partial [Oscillospiraceae bacterium]|nr:CotH kinase family protein [Oscillospiraceae bacterium]
MSTSKNFDRICIGVLILSILLTALFVNGKALGIQTADTTLGYENRLFDTSRVHTIDLVMDDWDGFIQSCTSEEYAACSVVIDGEAYKNVAIRGKGNTSLSSVSAMDSSRYSFKIEFDQYDSGKTYHGLDKLSLNNIIQDNTYMKDYLTYRLMAEFGVGAPLCSFVYITVNGEDWGLYLAVEGVEDSFLKRNYGSDAGELYKPDSMSFGGGGPGNGKDFNMEDFFKSGDNNASESDDAQGFTAPSGGSMPDFGGFSPDFGGGMPDFGGSMPDFSGSAPDFGGSAPGSGEAMPESPGLSGEGDGEKRGGFDMKGFDFKGAFGGMGSSDVKLQYANDDPDSYSNIFGNAKTDVSYADQKRLIASLKALSEGTDVESAVDAEKVIRYFIVHNFVCNGDSYTGSIVHNYYLHEDDGLLSMIPWDYNLAFGTFQGNDATGTVNDPIDSPLSVSDASDRPMWGWIVSNEEYKAQYHELFAEFLDSVDIQGIIDDAYALIASYVEKDPTAFCTYEEFETAVATLKSFCALREESVRGQLDGTIPS